MSIENHPNLHCVKFMIELEKLIDSCLRGNGEKLTFPRRLEIAQQITGTVEDLIDSEVGIPE